MAKYDFEFKKKIVEAYLNGEGGYDYLAKTYNLSDESAVRKWIGAYRAFGDKGLFRSRQKKEYSFNFKLALQNDINNPSAHYAEAGIAGKVFYP